MTHLNFKNKLWPKKGLKVIKAIDENFALNFTSIKGLQNKLWPSKVLGDPIRKISGFPS
jgi:hypothetical protein